MAKKKETKATFQTLNLELVSYMYRKGATDQEVADELGVCRRTIDNWKSKNPEFLQKVKHWKDVADEEIEKKLYERAKGYEIQEEKAFHDKMSNQVTKCEVRKHIPADVTAIIFWLKNRKPTIWRDRHEVAQTNTEISIEEFLKLNGKGESNGQGN